MNVLNTLRIALRALRRNVVRSLLTTLGIIVGVAAVIALVSIGNGARAQIAAQIASLGENIIIVFPGSTNRQAVHGGWGSASTLTPEDAAAILKEVPNVVAVSPEVRNRRQVLSAGKNWSTNIYGESPDFSNVRNWPIAEGAMFTEADVQRLGKVAVVGRSVAEQLFGTGVNPLGQSLLIEPETIPAPVTINVNGSSTAPTTTTTSSSSSSSSSPSSSSSSSSSSSPDTSADPSAASGSSATPPKDPAAAPFEIVGVLESKGFNVNGQDQDDVVIVPYSSYLHRIARRNNVNSILVQVTDPKFFETAQQQITTLLAQRHGVAIENADFTVRTQLELLDRSTETTNTMTLLLSGVAAVSLVVGGIGIMNIMLVSVTERTREIGIRLAVGAHARDVLRQFLIEAVILSSLGGLVGVVVGGLSSHIISFLNHWPADVSLFSVLIAVAFSASVGIFFGYYPATRAAQLDPIDALRFE